MDSRRRPSVRGDSHLATSHPALPQPISPWAQRCRLAPFVKLGRTIRVHRAGILATIEHGLANGRVEGLNNRVRLIVRRAFGFHSAQAALALVMLSCGPITTELPRIHPHQ